MALSVDTPTILCGSGKGGVGKTFLTVGTAMSLAKERAIGLLDLDVRSPNLTYVLGMDAKVKLDSRYAPFPATTELDGRLVQVFSSAMMFGDGRSITLGGEQMRSLVASMVHDVQWPELDYLVVDMDPSSGDTLPAISRQMEKVGAVVITTSDVSSLNDCRRFLDACSDLGIKVYGVVGNMIGVECPTCHAPLSCHLCGEAVEYGDADEVRVLAEEYHTRVLGSIPWDPIVKSQPRVAAATIGRRTFNAVADTIREVTEGPRRNTMVTTL